MGEPCDDISNPKSGMVVDFSEIKKWVKADIIDALDHSLVVSDDADIKNLKKVKQMFEKLKIVNFQPTCENLLIYIADMVKKNLPPHVSLYSLKLQETPSSYAEWYADDQS